MKDAVIHDSRWAAAIFAVCALGLVVGAALDLNTWPGQAFYLAFGQTSARQFFFAFQAFAAVLVLLFWCSAPSRALRLWVLLGWAATTALFWFGVPEVRPRVSPDPNGPAIALFFIGSMAVPSTAALMWRIARRTAADDLLEQRFRWLALLTLLFILVPQSALSLSATLHPATLDAYALHWDRVAGLGFTPALIAWVDRVPGLPTLAEIAYSITPIVFLSVPLLQLRGKRPHVASALLVWVGMTTAAMTAYHFFPITGPKYVFGSDKFVAALTNAASQPLALAQVAEYPRNGMPSMHFGWLLAASILWWQSGTRAWSRAIVIFMTVMTAIATLYTGEHYAVDLIVAVPFVLASLALCTTAVPWAAASRRNVVIAGYGCWLLWVLLLRTQIQLFIDQPLWCHALMLATAAVVAAQVRWMRRFAADVRDPLAVPIAASAEASEMRRLTHRFGLMFFVSGAAALVYQVLFAKQLALVFGSTATATFTVLATFLGGMALGSLLGGVWAQRARRPLVAYAYIELGIAAYCALTPQLFKGVQALYVALASGSAPDATWLLVLRVALGAGVLLVPTVLMGITLPMLAQALGPKAGRMGSRVAWLYFANTAGAALGALLTAYFVIPALGAQRTTLVAALLNLLVALGALELAKRALAPGAGDAAADAEATSATAYGPWVRTLALATLGIGGVLSLGLEVVYVHMLSIVAGNSVYAFGLMVATFLCGLSMGGELARRVLLLPRMDAPFALMLSLLGLSAAVTLGAWAWNMIPEYFATFAPFPLARSFGSREAIRGLVCAVVMIPPTIFIGAAYVLGMDIVTGAARRSKVRALGTAAAVNTAGNIAGVLLFGFVLLPWLGGLNASRVIAVAALLLAAAVLATAVRGNLRAALASVAVVLAVFVHGTTLRLDYSMLSSGSNVYFSPQLWGEVVDHAESIDGGLTTVARRDAPTPVVHTLLTNGKFQGNDAIEGEMQAQIGFALAPLLHQDRRGQALVIGYGTGATTRVLHEAGFEQVDIAELSGDIVRLADRYFNAVNAGVSSQPGVRLHVTDGRNLLLLSPKRYDVVSIEISSIWFAGAASLYNKEFYELVRARLMPEGVLQQWVQLHRLTPVDILTIVGTLRAEFRYVSLYRIGSQGILVATNDAARAAPGERAMHALQQAPGLAEVRRISVRDLTELPKDMLLGPDAVDRMLASAGADPTLWWSTDDNLRLEYSTPKANANDAEKTYRANDALFTMYR